MKICQISHVIFQATRQFFFQILNHSSVAWEITPLYFFSSNNICFAQKKAIKVKISETFECSHQNLSNSLCQFWNEKSISLQILYPSSVPWTITPLYFFSSNKIFFGHKDPIKTKIFLDFSSAQIKICQTSYVNFETTSRFLSKFCILVQFHKRLFLCIF